MSEITSHHVHNKDPEAFDEYVKNLNAYFLKMTENGKKQVFRKAGDLWKEYIESFSDPVERQYYNCQACHSFIKRYGGLVVIDDQGNAKSAVWDLETTPDTYKPAVTAMLKKLNKSSVTDVFYSDNRTWGVFESNHWTHLAIHPTLQQVFKDKVKTPYQAICAKHEDYKLISKIVGTIDKSVFVLLERLFTDSELENSAKYLPIVQWYLDIFKSKEELKNPHALKNIIWAKTASAPAGWPNINSGMIGVLIKAIVDGKDFQYIRTRWEEFTAPDKYRRTQKEASENAIREANKLIEKLGAQSALQRRIATIDEINPKLVIWAKPEQPPPHLPTETSGGAFDVLLKNKEKDFNKSFELPAKKISMDEFIADVLPKALKITTFPFYTGFGAITTQNDPNAIPVLIWDSEEKRNPQSWFVCNGPERDVQKFNTAGHPVEITLISRLPSYDADTGKEWFRVGAGYFLRTKDFAWTDSDNSLFTEILKSEFYTIRHVIEEFNKKTRIVIPQDKEQAAGLILHRFQNLTFDVEFETHSQKFTVHSV